MKKIRFACLFFICAAFISFDKGTPVVPANEINIKTPYGLVRINVPDFSKCVRIDIRQLGAVPGNKERTSQAIAAAIDKASAAGGGVVVIPEGEWLTKTIHFRSNVNLHLNTLV